MAKDCKAPKAEPVLNAARGNRPAAQGRVFAITGTEAEDANELIQGTCTICKNKFGSAGISLSFDDNKDFNCMINFDMPMVAAL